MTTPPPTHLLDHYDKIADGCVECGLCQKDCKFLQHYGSPKKIAEQRSLAPEVLRTSFECSLCWLCTAVCPKKIDPAAMFAAMRGKAAADGHGSFKKHGKLLSFERWGASPAISWYGLPEGCDTVLFPGCALAASRSGQVIELYNRLRQTIPALGIVLDCCTKPSHDLARMEYFHAMFGSLRTALADKGVKKVLVACPSCYKVWRDYGNTVAVATIYEELAKTGPLKTLAAPGGVTIHDPCPTRYEGKIHEPVRKLVRAMGFSLREMKHHGKKTLCCGEGGAACYIAGNFAGNWSEIRAREAQGDYIVTYCAGCTHFLGKHTPAGHLVDLFLDPEKTLAGKVRITRFPFTWIKRLLLKRKLKKLVDAKITGNRDKNGRVVLE